jgi:phospholipid/cholesterol/gamma-HCH transport system permease protein
MEKPFFTIDPSNKSLACRGDWTLRNFMGIAKVIRAAAIPKDLSLINGKNIQALDSAGALLLQQLIKNNPHSKFEEFSEKHQQLIQLITQPNLQSLKIPPKKKMTFLERLGRRSVTAVLNFINFLDFAGEVALAKLRLLFNLKQFPWKSLASTLETAGVQAMPIVALLSFSIGVVLAYELGLQLKDYGANVFIVDLLGMSILREFAPLMTAIIVAGRSGSAFTAQLGTMKIREEIDALKTMGLSPSELLVLPRVIGLLIALPLLTIWSALFAIAGGMVVANSMLQITYVSFLQRFYQEVTVNYYWTGMIKTPVFGLIIAAIGCYQGMQVFGSANSVGEKTTTSVVQSIFFIIIVDATFAIIFSWLNL